MTKTLSLLRINLPKPDRTLQPYTLESQEPLRTKPVPGFQTRVAFAAAHVVIDPITTLDPITSSVIDMPATLAFRRHLWSLGFGIAEAMDTAQRGMGLGWTDARELIRQSCSEAKAEGGSIACGANTDQVPAADNPSIDGVIAAYQEQCGFIESCGGRIILMASRSLARCARKPDDYRRVYSRILSQTAQPVILHWLGEAFDPSLEGYWGGSNLDESMEVCLSLIRDHQKSVDGIKISLLDKEREITMRRRLPKGVRMYTGDDFNYPELIQGDSQGHSDALLGIFDAIAPAASCALQDLDAGNLEGYRAWVQPTLPLSRHIFQKPTYYYKTGLVFLSYLNGHQNHFRMLGGQESARSILHLASLFIYADQARLLRDPEKAVERFRLVLTLAGVN